MGRDVGGRPGSIVGIGVGAIVDGAAVGSCEGVWLGATVVVGAGDTVGGVVGAGLMLGFEVSDVG